MNAHCKPAMIRFSSLHGSGMIAVFVPSWMRGRSSNWPPNRIRSLSPSDGSSNCGLPTGPAPYTESRSSDGVREFGDAAGSVGTPSLDVVSKATP